MTHDHGTRRLGLALAAGAMIVLAACTPPTEEYLVPITTGSGEARELYLEGRELVENLRFSEGRALFEQAVAEDPEFALAHLALANNAASTKDFFEHLRRATALVDAVSEGERHMILGAEAGAKGDVEAQLEHYSTLVEAFPEDERVQTLLGGYHFGQQEYREAAARFRRAISVNHEFPPPYNMLGYSQRFLEQYDHAEWAFKTYIELLPAEPNPYDSYAEMLMKQGRFDEAVENYEKALRLDPGFVASRVGIGNVRMFQGRFDEAREILGQVVDNAKDDGQRRQALFWKAAAYVHEGDTDGAVATLEEMAALAEAAGDHAAISGDHNMIGNVLYEAGRLDEAAARYDRALEAMESADVLDEVKAAAGRNRTYNELRVAVARGEVAEAKERAQAYRRAVSEAKAPAELRQYYEVAGLIAMAEKDYATAARNLSRGDQQNPRILYLHAEAQKLAGNAKRASTLGKKAAEFNGLGFDYAYVKTKAAQLLEEL